MVPTSFSARTKNKKNAKVRDNELGKQKSQYSHLKIEHTIDIYKYSRLSLSRTRKEPENLFDIERVRDRERKIGYSLHKGTATLVRDRERFEIEGV